MRAGSARARRPAATLRLHDGFRLGVVQEEASAQAALRAAAANRWVVGGSRRPGEADASVRTAGCDRERAAHRMHFWGAHRTDIADQPCALDCLHMIEIDR